MYFVSVQIKKFIFISFSLLHLFSQSINYIKVFTKGWREHSGMNSVDSCGFSFIQTEKSYHHWAFVVRPRRHSVDGTEAQEAAKFSFLLLLKEFWLKCLHNLEHSGWLHAGNKLRNYKVIHLCIEPMK